MSQFYAFKGHEKQISRIVSTMFSGTSASITFIETAADLADAPADSSFIVCSTGPDKGEPYVDMPPGLYPAMRDAGMNVWHISESYAIAKRNGNVLNTGMGDGPAPGAASGLVTEAALEELRKPAEPPAAADGGLRKDKPPTTKGTNERRAPVADSEA